MSRSSLSQLFWVFCVFSWLILPSPAADAPKAPDQPKQSVLEFAATLEPSRTIVYKKVQDRELHLYLFEPANLKPTDRRPCLVLVHGGGWTGLEPRRVFPFADHFAKLGLLGISVEYRLVTKDSSNTVFDCVKDGRSAVRYVRAHAAELGIDPQKITVSGESAGAHIASGTALFDNVNESGEATDIPCAPNALILLYPVIDTSKEGYGNEKIGEGWQELSPVHHVHPGLPPTLVFHATGDKITPFKGAKTFHELMLKAGNRCELDINEGGPHGYVIRDRAQYDLALPKMEKFLDSLGLLHKKQ